MSNVLDDEQQQQGLALGRLGWTLRRIEAATGVRRETASGYLRAAGIAVRGRGRPGEGAPGRHKDREHRLRLSGAGGHHNSCDRVCDGPVRVDAMNGADLRASESLDSRGRIFLHVRECPYPRVENLPYCTRVIKPEPALAVPNRMLEPCPVPQINGAVSICDVGCDCALVEIGNRSRLGDYERLINPGIAAEQTPVQAATFKWCQRAFGLVCRYADLPDLVSGSTFVKSEDTRKSDQHVPAAAARPSEGQSSTRLRSSDPFLNTRLTVPAKRKPRSTRMGLCLGSVDSGFKM